MKSKIYYKSSPEMMRTIYFHLEDFTISSKRNPDKPPVINPPI